METNVVTERLAFVVDLESRHWSMTELCERYGASIEYRLRPDGHRDLFLVVMRREGLQQHEPRPNAAA